MLDGDVTGNEIGGDQLGGIVIGISAGAVIALCGVLAAWLKWRHPPKDG